jgi:hypothetical protein
MDSEKRMQTTKEKEDFQMRVRLMWTLYRLGLNTRMGL